LYGTTGSGGDQNLGTIFSVPVGGGAVTTLASFNGANGAGPFCNLTLIGGSLYGTTRSGSGGTVFSVPVGGGAITTLANFSANQNPNGGLTLVGGALYGTTFSGGDGGFGSVFSVPVGGGEITTVASFLGQPDGMWPEGGLTLSADGNTLYGTTHKGGTNGTGSVFALALSGGSTSAPVSSGSSYAGFSSTSTVGHSTTVALLGGTASAATTVTASFSRVPLATGENDFAAGQNGIVRNSDILSLSGLNATGSNGYHGSILTEEYVLQLSYDPNATGVQYITYYDQELGQFVNAISGNSDHLTDGGDYLLGGPGIGNYVVGPYAPAIDITLGDYGYDPATHTAWAVLDHNSDFAVAGTAPVPEPSSVALLSGGVALLFLTQRLRRKR
jgi:uncharacterized repeat protein (TIGR03803 family)